MRILILEDDAEMSDYLGRGLRELGHEVVPVADGRSALALTLSDQFDVLVLDRMVSGLDGLTMLRLARESGCQTPTLLLTAMARIEDRVAGLEGGADDYLVKPFAFAEFTARLGALARRPPPADLEPEPVRLVAGTIALDLIKREVRRDGALIDVQPREFALLEYLVRNAGRVVTRTMLLDRVWNFSFDPKTNIVETHVSRLRAKLNQGFASDAIRTIRGVGYMVLVDE